MVKDSSYEYYERSIQTVVPKGTFLIQPKWAISGWNTRDVRGISSADECAKLCYMEKTFFCQSFDHLANDKLCRLSKTREGQTGVSMAQNPRSISYGERTNLTAKADNFTVSRGEAISGWNDKTINKITLAACKRACTFEKSFVCKSFDYISDGRDCNLSKKAKGDAGVSMVKDRSYQYYERSIQTVVPKGTFLIQPKWAISGWNTRDVRGISSADECAKLCYMEKTFFCQSFDHLANDKLCRLSKTREGQSGVSMAQNPSSISYGERTNLTAKADSFTYSKGEAISGWNDKVLTMITPEACKRACSSEKSFVCKSIDYINSGKECNLSRKARGDRGVSMVKMSSYTYYERIIKKTPAPKP